jgi:hypothetical protein
MYTEQKIHYFSFNYMSQFSDFDIQQTRFMSGNTFEQSSNCSLSGFFPPEDA